MKWTHALELKGAMRAGVEAPLLLMSPRHWLWLYDGPGLPDRQADSRRKDKLSRRVESSSSESGC